MQRTARQARSLDSFTSVFLFRTAILYGELRCFGIPNAVSMANSSRFAFRSSINKLVEFVAGWPKGIGHAHRVGIPKQRIHHNRIASSKQETEVKESSDRACRAVRCICRRHPESRASPPLCCFKVRRQQRPHPGRCKQEPRKNNTEWGMPWETATPTQLLRNRIARSKPCRRPGTKRRNGPGTHRPTLAASAARGDRRKRGVAAENFVHCPSYKATFKPAWCAARDRNCMRRPWWAGPSALPHRRACEQLVRSEENFLVAGVEALWRFHAKSCLR